MITLKEILKDKELLDQSEEVRANLAILLDRINKVRAEYNKPMTVTSGLRTKEDQIRVYRQKAEKMGAPFDESKVPMGSQHIRGAAIDIYDPNKDLQQWCRDNEQFLADTELWMEDFSATPNWVHFQIYPPKSGNRWFKP